MKTSIQWKIIAIYLCIVLVIMMASGSFILYNVAGRNYQTLANNLKSAAQAVQIHVALDEELDIDEDIDEITERLSSVVAADSILIYILDGNGNVRTSTTGAEDIISEQVVLEAISNKEPAIKEYSPFLTINSYIKKEVEQEKLDYALPIVDATTEEITSIIYVSSDVEEIIQNTKDIASTIVVASIMAMGLATIFSAVFARMITVPIKQLTSSAKLLAAGSFNRIPIYSTDEIGQLTQSFNYMASELSRTMSEISSEKNKLEKILENMADGVMAFNRQGVLIHANSVCYDMIGDEHMDHRFDFIYSRFGVDVSFDRILADEIDLDEDIIMETEDRLFSLHFAPYRNVLGENEGLVVVMQDITEQHKLDQMRKEFVANVSHELRTPLTTVKSYTETLLDGAIEDKDISMQFLNVMNKEADRMTTLVHDLLELSRIDNRQMQLNMVPIDLKELVLDTLDAQKIHAEKKGHDIVLKLDETAAYMMLGDSARMRQILHNILSNAIKYSIDPGKITIRLFKNEEIVVQIQDTGIGMSNNDLKRIFERFYRVDKARSRSMGGTGLGLAIVKEMVELHGGKIKVASKLGKGTTVTVAFKALDTLSVK